jgi:tetratricopeptide (TPR) repeat protein
LCELAELYRAQRKYGKAESLYLKALPAAEKSLGSQHPEVAVFLHNLALLYQAREEFPKAKVLFVKAIQILRASPGSNPFDVTRVLENYAACLRAAGEESLAHEKEVEAAKWRSRSYEAEGNEPTGVKR